MKSPRLALLACATILLWATTALSQSTTDRFLDPMPPVLPAGQEFHAEVLVAGSRTRVRIAAAGPGSVTWPMIDADPAIAGWILPLAEGHYIPADDPEWIANLETRSPIDTTAALSMPWIALDLDGATLTFIFENPFDNGVTFSAQNGRLAARVTHEFKANWDVHEFPVTVVVGEDTPIAPAHAYRQWLIERDEFVSMERKIQRLPRAGRLLGATHAYLWGTQALAREDIPRHKWPEFCRRLAGAREGSIGYRVFSRLSDNARQTVLELPGVQWPDNYMKGVIVWDISRVLAAEEIDLAEFQAEFPEQLGDASSWGDGYSIKMLDAFQEAGLDRLCLSLGGWEGTRMRPGTATHADELGYLLGTYDSYHSIHRPDAHENSTWATAQFSWEAWNNACIMRADGSYGTGFKGRGRHLSPLVALPLVKERVGRILSGTPFNATFIDCDAYGEFFDDYHPDHSANQRQDMEARLQRLAWIEANHGLVIGSEGGSAYSAPVIHFAHGMMTPVIGWADPRNRDRKSKYFRGAYYPPDGPANFVMQVPLAPEYVKFHYDPRFRLPLCQAAFHDSVIATHHWGTHSLKFTDQIVTNTLLEMLYQVPPMYHMNLREFPKHRDRMVATHEFFSPLHRETALMPLTGFEWLSADRLVQSTTYGDEITLVANFSDESFRFAGVEIPARSILGKRSKSDQTVVFTPAEP